MCLFLISGLLIIATLLVIYLPKKADKDTDKDSSLKLEGWEICSLPHPAAPSNINYALGNKWFPTKWGAEDTLGAKNYITPGKVLTARKLVRTGKSYGMAVLSSPTAPAFGNRFWHMNVREEVLGGPTNTTYMEDEVNASIGVGTHIDGLGHISIGRTWYNGASSGKLNAKSRFGVDYLSTSDVGGIVTRVVVLNMVDFYGKKMVGGQVIFPKDIVGAANKQGVCIGRGDAVFFWTGWLDVWLKDSNTTKFLASYPGIGVESGEYLANLGVVAVGADTIGVEAIPGEEGTGLFNVHQILITKYGVYLVEMVNSKPFLDAGHSEALLVIGVPKLGGSVQTNVNPIAIV